MGKAKDRPPIERLREICLALPGATEKEAWGEPTFRVCGKMFAMYDNNHHNAGRIAVWVNAPPLAQNILVERDPEQYFVPPYMGPSGWVGIRLDLNPDWAEVSAIIADGHRVSAEKRPKRQHAERPKSGASRARGKK